MSSTTGSTQTNAPPAWAAPLYTQSATETGSLYNSGAGGNAYAGPTTPLNHQIIRKG